LLTKNKYIVFVGMLFGMLQACTPKKSPLPDLKESFSYQDTRPFGASVAYSILQNAYPDNDIEISKTEFAQNYSLSYDTGAVYINISRNYFVTEKDADALLEFVYKGNTAFISAARFDTLLLNKIYCKKEDDYNYYAKPPYQNTSVSYTEDLSLYTDSFSFYYYPLDNYFSELNSSYARKVGVNEKGKTNMFAFLWGKGRIYFQCEPRAYSNYFLLTNNNYKYWKEVLQMLPANPSYVYWDNYYARKNFGSGGNKDGSTLSEIMKYPQLKAAFFISLFLLLLFVLLGLKRKQRIVPVVKPTENTSIAFAEAIAGLYLSKKDNKVVAEKMITYFNEHVRTKYFLNIHINDSSYADILSRKTAVPIDITKQLTDTILSINASVKVSDEQLLLLNGLMEKFFKKGS
jgi:hypothetical protein